MIVVLALIAAVSTASADQAYAANDYAHAAALYGDVVKEQPANAQAWYRLGVSDAAISRLEDAKIALNKALTLGYDAMSVHYRLATLASKSHDAVSAVAELQAAMQARPIPISAITGDDAFAPVKSSRIFASFVDRQARLTEPCKYDPAYRALDFWIGDWTVTSGESVAGKSHVEAAVDGCAILEQWTGAYDSPGRSISAYDAASKTWMQRYVSGRARITDYAGSVLPDGSIQLTASNGKTLTRMTYTRLANGSVRQRFEISNDGGVHWTPPNDLIYERAP